MMHSYESLNEYLGGKSDRPAPETSNNTRVQRRGDNIVVRLHNTDIVTFTPSGDVILNSGGYKTVTTKARMNEYIGNYTVYQERKVWYVAQGWDGERHLFADGMTITADGEVMGAGSDNDAKAQVQLARDIRKYARGYAKAFAAGDVGAPDLGDCLGCALFEKEGMGGTDHLLFHMEESYYVPSLLVRVAESHLGNLLSPFTMGVIGNRWYGDGDGNEWEIGIATEQIESAIARWLSYRLELAS